MKCNHAHYCPEWDLLWIKPQDIEFEACLCECDNTCKYINKEVNKVLNNKKK